MTSETTPLLCDRCLDHFRWYNQLPPGDCNNPNCRLYVGPPGSHNAQPSAPEDRDQSDREQANG